MAGAQEIEVMAVNDVTDSATMARLLRREGRSDFLTHTAGPSGRDPASCLFDSLLTEASGRPVKVFGWYDNEGGYTARLVDLTRMVAKTSDLGL